MNFLSRSFIYKYKAIRHVSRFYMSTTKTDAPSQDNIRKILSDLLAKPRHRQSSVKAEDFCNLYRSLSDEKGQDLLHILAEEYTCDSTSVSNLIRSLHIDETKTVWVRTAEKLRQELLPQYYRLFVNIGRTAGGVKFLVDLRADIQRGIRSESGSGNNAYLRSLDQSLKQLLSLWFSLGLLHLERITWQSPCDLVQKICDYEAVHPVRSWTDVRQRLGPYRRCFVFTHRCMPGEPVVVLHVALTDQISSRIHDIVSYPSLTDSLQQSTTSDEDCSKINTAVFYSITATQKGLAGIELGQHLIKRTVSELQKEFPMMHQFSSLSPIPGFTDWLLMIINRALNNKDCEIDLLKCEERNELCRAFGGDITHEACIAELKRSVEQRSWVKNDELTAAMRAPLTRLCGVYLYREKRRNYALNPVANFHLTNGAVMWRLNWLADLSPRGLANSCGMMVNYRYFLDDLETNMDAYLDDYVVRTSQQFDDVVGIESCR